MTSYSAWDEKHAGEIIDGASVDVSADAKGLTIDGKPAHSKEPAAALYKTAGNA